MGPLFSPQRHFAACVRLWPPRFHYTTYPPFQAYAVEGWWLDNLLKGGKLTRQTYLTLVAQVTVGFQKRLGDCKATERFLREEVVRDKPHIWKLVCKSMKYSNPSQILVNQVNQFCYIFTWVSPCMGLEPRRNGLLSHMYRYSVRMYIRIYTYTYIYVYVYTKKK